MELSPMTILMGLIPVLGIGAGYFFLEPLKNMFKRDKHKEQTKKEVEKVKELTVKQTEVIAKIEHIEKLSNEAKGKISVEIKTAQEKIDAIVKSEKSIEDLGAELDKEW